MRNLWLEVHQVLTQTRFCHPGLIYPAQKDVISQGAVTNVPAAFVQGSHAWWCVISVVSWRKLGGEVMWATQHLQAFPGFTLELKNNDGRSIFYHHTLISTGFTRRIFSQGQAAPALVLLNMNFYFYHHLP